MIATARTFTYRDASSTSLQLTFIRDAERNCWRREHDTNAAWHWEIAYGDRRNGWYVALYDVDGNQLTTSDYRYTRDECAALVAIYIDCREQLQPAMTYDDVNYYAHTAV